MRLAAAAGDESRRVLAAVRRLLCARRAALCAGRLHAPAPRRGLSAAAPRSRGDRVCLSRSGRRLLRRADPLFKRPAPRAGRLFACAHGAALGSAHLRRRVPRPQRSGVLPAGPPHRVRAAHRLAAWPWRRYSGARPPARRADTRQPGAQRRLRAPSAHGRAGPRAHAAVHAAGRAHRARAARLRPARPADHRGLSLLHRSPHRVFPRLHRLSAAGAGASGRHGLAHGRSRHAGQNAGPRAASRHGQKRVHRPGLGRYHLGPPLSVRQSALFAAAPQSL